MNVIWDLLAAAAAGLLGAMGFGGGGVLLLYLTLVDAVPQMRAQGLNLLCFLPVALVSVFINHKRRWIRWSDVLWMTLGGLITVLPGLWIAEKIDTIWLGRIFGGVLMIAGIRTFCSKSAA